MFVYRRSILLQTRHPSLQNSSSGIAVAWLCSRSSWYNIPTWYLWKKNNKSWWPGNPILVGGFKDFVIFTPTWGRFPIWTNIFQRGWNHQLVWYNQQLKIDVPQTIVQTIQIDVPTMKITGIPKKTCWKDKGGWRWSRKWPTSSCCQDFLVLDIYSVMLKCFCGRFSLGWNGSTLMGAQKNEL